MRRTDGDESLQTTGRGYVVLLDGALILLLGVNASFF